MGLGVGLGCGVRLHVHASGAEAVSYLLAILTSLLTVHACRELGHEGMQVSGSRTHGSFSISPSAQMAAHKQPGRRGWGR